MPPNITAPTSAFYVLPQRRPNEATRTTRTRRPPTDMQSGVDISNGYGFVGSRKLFFPWNGMDPFLSTNDLSKFSSNYLYAGKYRSFALQHPPAVPSCPEKKTLTFLSFIKLSILLCCLQTIQFNIFRMRQSDEKASLDDFFQDNWNIGYNMDICFITSVFAESRYLADRVPPANLRDEPGFQHFLLTNLDDLQPLGWQPIVTTNLTFSRMTTQSRWGKFMAWKIPLIRNSCNVVFYMDGTYETVAAPAAYRSMARQILFSKQWMQQRHKTRSNVLKKINAIRDSQADTPENINATLGWLRSQSDQYEDAPLYENTWIGYDPNSASFQNFTMEFWHEYSKEKTTWRDQPLWSYLLWQHHINPIPFPDFATTYFHATKESRGFGGHRYIDNGEPNDLQVDRNLPICFVTSVYASDETVADRVPPADLRAEPHIQHFLFTNLQSLSPLGWTPILLTNLTYKRMITRSRYAKFMAWQIPMIRDSCSVVFYMDGIYETVAGPTAYRRLAHQVLSASDKVLMQNRHNRGRNIMEELNAIELAKKDTTANVAKTLHWLREQPEFCPNCTAYQNTFFAYDPKNPRFQELTKEFWNEYSKEQGSWRDQPLWAHFVAKNNIKPIFFPHPSFSYFHEVASSKGFGDHIHVHDVTYDKRTPLGTLHQWVLGN